MSRQELTIGLSGFQFGDIAKLAGAEVHLSLSADSMARVSRGFEWLRQRLEGNDDAMYGINTGFGSLCNTRIADADLEQLQYNLIRSHACGTGVPVRLEIVRLMLYTKVRSLAFGHSAAHPDTVQALINLYNHDLLPVVYDLGSLGASGDLAPLAHLCLPLIGEGEVWMNGKQVSAAEALRSCGLSPVRLHAKEGLALLNGTQFMLAHALYIAWQASRVADWADAVAAISLEAFDGLRSPFLPHLHRIRPHQGQVKTASNILRLLEGSEIMDQPKAHVQDPYSFRCVPQVHGASRDALAHAISVFMTEADAVSDNPNVFPDEGLVLSGGNFHGQPLALALDYLCLALSEWASISERRLYLLISGQRGLPPFLTANAGLQSGFMIVQYAAAAVVSQSKTLCFPASADSIISSNGQEDHVSMGANAAVKCLKVLGNTWRVLSMELLTASQAASFRGQALAPALTAILDSFRVVCPVLQQDVIMASEMSRALDWIEKTKIDPV